MKRLIFYLNLLIILLILSCNKEETNNSDQLPEWLQAKIAELVSDQNLCKITDVKVIEYKEKRYYHLYCGIWSCMYCQLFDQQGNRPVWETTEWNDFFANKKEIKVVLACQ